MMSSNIGVKTFGRGALVAAIGCTIVLAGCSRRHYRQRADVESAELVAEKQDDPRWMLRDFQVYPDKRARFYDPNDPDRPPMPPDDPAAHKFMHVVYKMKGYKKWHQDGDEPMLENPYWTDYLTEYADFTDDGKLNLTKNSVTLLARTHNRDYQENLEEIYLASLDVAFERFRFDVQFFGGTDTNMLTSGNESTPFLGRLSQPGPRPARSILDQRGNLMFSRQFAAGGQLMAGFANSMVWQFAGPDTNFSSSILNFSFLQPLLRQGGKRVFLEQLTRVERNLLGNLRAQTQFRQQFYIDVFVGGGTSVRPRRIGGFQGGAGLTGFTGTGAGGFGGVGQSTGFGGFGGGGGGGSGASATTAGLAGGGEGIIGGYYGLVQRLQTIRNTEASLTAQQGTLGLLLANFEAGLIELVQVDEFRQNIETEQANLLRSRVSYQDSLEFFLVDSLGLPPTLPVEVADDSLEMFDLIDEDVSDLQNRINALLQVTGNLPESPSLDVLNQIKQQLQQISDELVADVEIVSGELTELVENKNQRLENIDAPSDRAAFEKDLKTMQDTLESLKVRTAQNEQLFNQIDRLLAPGTEAEATNQVVELLRKISSETQEMSLVQARVRLERVTIPRFELAPEDAFLIARENRLDWMNRRAALVDQWRLVAFNANRLQSTVNVTLDGDLGTLGDNGLKFRGPTGNLRAGLEFDAPLAIKGERNQYRESLIEYQRAKRSYVEFVDNITLSLRSRLRQLERLRANMEIQRRALVIAIRRVDQTLEDLNEPVPPPQPGQPQQQLGPTLAQNLLGALADFRNTQDNFLSVWLNYLQARMNLQFELGLIEFDDRGQWVERSIDELVAEYLPLCQEAQAEHCPVEEALFEEMDEDVSQGRGKRWIDKSHNEDVKLAHLVSREIDIILPEGVSRPKDEHEETEGRGLIRLPSWLRNDKTESSVSAQQPANPKKKSPALFARLQNSLWKRPQPETSATLKQIGEESAESVSMDEIEFLRNLRLVAGLKEQGMKSSDIAKTAHLELPVVKAYEQALNRAKEPVLTDLGKKQTP